MAYDPKKVTIIVDGQYITGFSDDTKVTAEREEDTQMEYVGVDGEVDSSINANESGTITVPVKSTSPSVRYLNKLANARKTFNTSVVDSNDNGTNANGVQCFVRQPMFPEVGKEISEVEYEIFVGNLTID